MASVTLAIPDEIKSEMKELAWVNWSELVREETLELLRLSKKLNSKEERELIKWSVELGRKAKKGRFKRLLAKLSPKERGELLSELSPKQKAKLGL